jgi:hypothetical protein
MEEGTLIMFKQSVVIENEMIWVKPICDFFEINYENQTRKIKSDSILANQSTKKSNSLMFSDNYPRVLLTKKGFIRWIQLVNANTIEPGLQKQFMFFQEMIFDYLYGSVEEDVEVRRNYTRLQKLDRLKDKIAVEIRREKALLEQYLDSRYIQTTMSFPEQKQISN